MLFTYQQQVQRFLRDANQTFINPEDLRNYINQSRRQIALRTQCVRVLAPTTSSIRAATITAAGSGYVTPVATISAPDYPNGSAEFPLGAQATATVTQLGGVISNIDIDYGGSGYYQPVITITDSTGPGTGATATLTVGPISQTENGQEIYRYSDIPLENFPGVEEVFWVNSVSLIYANYRYSLMTYSFSTYQAKIRNFPLSYRYVPSVCAQLGRGTAGSLYLYPVASASYQLELDCFCLPSDLENDQSEEAIPQPWQDCVPWYAAHLAFLELQNFNAANYYDQLTNKRISDYSTWTAPRRSSNRYGRW